jgi:surface protein
MFREATAMINEYNNVAGFGTTPTVNFFNITKLTDLTIHQLVNEWTSNPEQLQFIDGTHVPYYGNIKHWDTSIVTDMSGLFMNKTGFNDDISYWNTSGVTDMNAMFQGCTDFDQNISKWDTSKVTDMDSMFQDCTAFDQNIRSWNVKQVITVNYVQLFNNMFLNASDMIITYIAVSGFGTTPTDEFFNITKLTDRTIHQAVNDWTTNPSSKQFTTGTNNPYYGNIEHWDTSQVTNMSNLFNGKSNFNDDISNWNTSKVTNMSFMFNGCTAFNQAFNQVVSFNTSQVTSMYYMFNGCTVFNKEVLYFNTSHVTNMSYMFAGCTDFDQNVRYFLVADTTVLTNMFLGADDMIGISRPTPQVDFFNQNQVEPDN